MIPVPIITRSVRLNLGYANVGKLRIVNDFIVEYVRVTNEIIKFLWKTGCSHGSFISKEEFGSMALKTWLPARARQAAGTQALANVRSQREKKKKSCPKLEKQTVNLDSRFSTLHFGVTKTASFDGWVKLQSITAKPGSMMLPRSYAYRLLSSCYAPLYGYLEAIWIFLFLIENIDLKNAVFMPIMELKRINCCLTSTELIDAVVQSIGTRGTCIGTMPSVGCALPSGTGTTDQA